MQRQRLVVQQTQQSAESERQKREHAEQARQSQLAEEREARQRAEEMEARQLAEEQKLKAYRIELSSCVEGTLIGQGYLPPEPSPLVWRRTLNAVAHQMQRHKADPDFGSVIKAFECEVDVRCLVSDGLLEQITENLTGSFLQNVLPRVSGIHKSINKATVSIELPDVAPALQKQMSEIEVFLAKDWTRETHRGVMAVHVDELNQATIIQIGVAEHGPVYITIPELLRPETEALKSIAEVLKRLAPFTGTVDPMAVIDGSHQKLNYNEIFRKSRVYRAPSGNTLRLTRNLQESARRERLSADNTVILNSAPKSEAEYVRIFPQDVKGQHWAAWGSEAQEWHETVVSNQFRTSPEVSHQALLTALTEAKNVIVIVAHCDGESIFMPEPPPTGSIVTADYLREHQAEIEANAPFVYLFSCQAGDLSNLQNFASTLLDCGASGVVASQTDVGSAEARTLLARLLDEGRGAPPIEDYFRAIQAVKYLDMEVFVG